MVHEDTVLAPVAVHVDVRPYPRFFVAAPQVIQLLGKISHCENLRSKQVAS